MRIPEVSETRQDSQRPTRGWGFGQVVNLGFAVLLGGGTGLGIVLFRKLIALLQGDVFGRLGEFVAGAWGDWAVLFVPAVGGLLVGLIVRYALTRDRYPGVAGVMEACALGGGRLEYRLAPAKTLAAVVSISAGASVGPEDPSVQIGANLGSALARWMHGRSDEVRVLVAAGAAGGIAAAFNAPMAGIFFALEIILGQFSGEALAVVMLSAVAASVVAQAGLGTQPAFVVPPYQLRSAWELPLYLGLGVLAALVAAIYVRALGWFEVQGQRWPRGTRPLRTLVGGLVVGVVGLWVPQALGVGYDTIGSFLQGHPFTVGLLLLALVAKLLLTPWSLGMGFVGGVFAPSIFLGAMLGGIYGSLVHQALPAVTAVAPAYAMVGMAAVLAATVRAPLTAILIAFEMTRDYRIVLPLIAAVGIAMIVGTAVQPHSVYTAALHRRGVDLRVRLGQWTGARVLQLRVATGAAAVGRSLAELGLPAGWVVAAIHRGTEVIVPQGATRLQAEDQLVLVTQGGAEWSDEALGCFLAAGR